MKKISLLILLSFGISQLFAEATPPFTYHVGGHFGQNFTDKNSKMRDDALYGIRGTVMLTPFYGLNIGYDRIDKIDIKDSGSTIDLQRIYGQIEVDGEEQYHVVPYITIGAGYEILSSDVVVAGHKHDVSQGFISGGLGFRYNFIPELSIFTEGNFLWKTDTTDVSYNILAGLQYHINATTCDKTYVTDRLNEKPQERNVLHVGAVNNLSNWKKPKVKPVLRKPVPVQKRVQKISPAKVTVKKTKKSVVVKPVTKIKKNKKSTAHKTYKKRAVSGVYYISMGVFKTKKGLRQMIAKLERADVPYILRDIPSKRRTYVLVGAYPNISKAKKDLVKLKRIQRDAYIRKMK